MGIDSIEGPADCAAALERLFRETPVRSDWFTAAFLAGAPVAAITSIVVKLIDRYGPYQHTIKINDGWVVRRGNLSLQHAVSHHMRGVHRSRRLSRSRRDRRGADGLLKLEWRKGGQMRSEAAFPARLQPHHCSRS